MKRILLASAGLLALALAQPAAAADLPVRMPTKGPVLAAPVIYNWTGFYVGAHLGYAWGDKDWWDPTFLGVAASHNVDGFIGGVQAGYNWQAGQWVFGIEGDISWADMNGNALCGPALAFTCNSDVNWLATLTGRVGYTWDRMLLYVKGGVAWADDSYTFATGAGVFGASSGDGSRSGWTLGVGLEYAFWNNWSTKIEYNYMDFGTDRVTFFNGAANIANPDVDQTVHAIKLGVNYRFGWGGPVVARY